MIDIATIKIKAGKGGDGHVSFRREKFIPHGGPDGGDGGNGGSVYLVADHNLATLMDFRTKPVFEATSGAEGRKKKMSGLSADDLYIKVPVGTLVYELKEPAEQKVLVGDLTEEGQKLLIAKGGHGGKGNWRFRSSTNQVPMEFTPGGRAQVKTITLEIKLIADVGLVGLPNSGKSTLLNHLTNANAKVANYPFTTITPNLGVCKLTDSSTIVVADLPGLIEGASSGKGLGYDFLRHIERTRLLVHVLDVYTEDINSQNSQYANLAKKSYQIIRNELKIHNEELLQKPEIVVINKIDITEVKEALPAIIKDFKRAFKKEGVIREVLGISAVTGEGLEALKLAIMKELAVIKEVKHFDVDMPVKIYTIEDLPNRRAVFK